MNVGHGEIWSKGVSGTIAGAYVVYVAITCGVASAALIMLLLFIPVALIWFGDDIELPVNEFSDLPSGRTPGFLVRFIGWVLLLFPIIISVYLKYGRQACMLRQRGYLIYGR